MGNIVAIVGRPNVGKSTLFNRLIQQKSAIIHETSGVTRDRHYGKCNWNGQDFSVIDTGGYVVNSDDIFEGEIRKHAKIAIEESDIIIFLVDVISGITDLDDEIAKILRKSKKEVILVVNKVDNAERQYDANVFYGLGLGDIYNISSINGSGTGELLDKLVELFPKSSIDEVGEDIPKFAIVGRPNVGKSSLVNALVGEERNIVTPISGTTRDSIHTRFNKFGHDFILTDTAGLRKKGKVKENIEFYSVMRSIRSIEESDVSLLLIDATRGIESQDVNVFHLIERNNKAVVILVNKWDLVEKTQDSVKEFTKSIKERIAPFVDVPIIFTSAVTKQRILKVLEVAIEVYENKKRKIPTAKLNEYLQEIIANNHPPSVKGKFVKIKYVSQLPTQSPTFAFYCNLPQYVIESYKRFLENKIREKYNFHGVPISIFMRKK